jgi:hypothetical protein
LETVWLATGGGQQMHIAHVEGFEVLPFEGEFGRHIAIFHPAQEIAALKKRLLAARAHLMQPLRASTKERFFFREPVNGYVCEVIAQT